jgi:mannan endo-1,4-beta-mannosidase
MIINRLRSCLLALTLLAAFSACSNSSSSTHHDDGGSGGATSSGGTTNVGTGSGGILGSGGATFGAGTGGSTGPGTGVGLDAGLGPDSARDGSVRLDTGASGSGGTDGNAARDGGGGRNDATTGTDVAKDVRPSEDAPSALDANAADLVGDTCAADGCGVRGAVSRPTYNAGTGFFVTGGKLYDANGVEFRIRGVNKCHYDAAWPGIPKTHANTIRWGVPLWLAGNVSSKLMQDSIDAKIVPMAGVWFTAGTYADADNVTCKEDTAHLTTAVDQWVAQAATFKSFEKYVLINVANEWGPANSTVWRDAYITAVARMRAAGYLGTLVIDAGGCGQDAPDVATYAQAIFDSDSQRNIVFDVHIYGQWSNGGGQSWQTDLNSGLDSLKATSLPIILGEFGPGRNIGPSPTMITPGQVITAAETRGMGWLAWAWDDPANNVNDATDFALSYAGAYNSSADLTTFGKDVVENATYGLLHLGQPATSF